MATSRSVAATVSRSSPAVSLTHCRTGLGVLAATTLPQTLMASNKAPRLQITFMNSLSLADDCLVVHARTQIGPPPATAPSPGGPVLYRYLYVTRSLKLFAVLVVLGAMYITFSNQTQVHGSK